MWISLFTVVLAIALGLAGAAIALESQPESKALRNLNHR